MKTIKQQVKKYGPRRYTERGVQYRITAEVRHDDSCGNGHNSFAITGEIDRQSANGRWQDDACGCIHDEIVKHFPDLAPFIKWHLSSTDGPMHYLANTLYMAGDRDCHGKRKGEIRSTETRITFGSNPIKHRFGKRFMGYLASLTEYDLEIFEIPHKGDGEQFGHKFDPKYTVGTFKAEWYQCPFDTEDEASAFIYALQNCGPTFLMIATAWGEGKEPELDAARRAAIWPEATLDQLQDKAALEARLPSLLAEFKADVESLGLTF